VVHEDAAWLENPVDLAKIRERLDAGRADPVGNGEVVDHDVEGAGLVQPGRDPRISAAEGHLGAVERVVQESPRSRAVEQPRELVGPVDDLQPADSRVDHQLTHHAAPSEPEQENAVAARQRERKADQPHVPRMVGEARHVLSVHEHVPSRGPPIDDRDAGHPLDAVGARGGYARGIDVPHDRGDEERRDPQTGQEPQCPRSHASGAPPEAPATGPETEEEQRGEHPLGAHGRESDELRQHGAAERADRIDQEDRAGPGGQRSASGGRQPQQERECPAQEDRQRRGQDRRMHEKRERPVRWREFHGLVSDQGKARADDHREQHRHHGGDEQPTDTTKGPLSIVLSESREEDAPGRNGEKERDQYRGEVVRRRGILDEEHPNERDLEGQGDEPRQEAKREKGHPEATLVLVRSALGRVPRLIGQARTSVAPDRTCEKEIHRPDDRERRRNADAIEEHQGRGERPNGRADGIHAVEHADGTRLVRRGPDEAVEDQGARTADENARREQEQDRGDDDDGPETLRGRDRRREEVSEQRGEGGQDVEAGQTVHPDGGFHRGVPRERPRVPPAEQDGAEPEPEEEGSGDNGRGDGVPAEVVPERSFPDDLVDEAAETRGGNENRDRKCPPRHVGHHTNGCCTACSPSMFSSVPAVPARAGSWIR
jgi:hypothetical protein